MGNCAFNPKKVLLNISRNIEKDNYNRVSSLENFKTTPNQSIKRGKKINIQAEGSVSRDELLSTLIGPPTQKRIPSKKLSKKKNEEQEKSEEDMDLNEEFVLSDTENIEDDFIV